MNAKRFKIIVLMVIVALIVIGFYGHGFYMDYKAKQKFCKSSFNGKVFKKKIVSRGALMIMLRDEKWQYLGIYYDDQISKIEIGDSISKEENSFNIFLIEKSGTKINLTRERFRIEQCK